jgi:hypothetical protein
MKHILLILMVVLAACAHQKTFEPEVSGPGVIYSHGGVVYPIPAKDPVIKMKLVSLGLNENSMLHMRMFFSRKGDPAGEYVDPMEQQIFLPGSEEGIKPSKVHAQTKFKPVVHLDEPAKQYIELLFALPKGGTDLEFVNFKWSVHYKKKGKDKVVSQFERFDHTHHFDQQGVGNYPTDPDFPFAEFSTAPEDSDWNSPGFLWW